MSRRALSDRTQVRARLLARRYTLRSWALAHGYEVRTVSQAVQRWAGRAELPRGLLTFRILRDLSRTINQEIVPGILRAETATPHPTATENGTNP